MYSESKGVGLVSPKYRRVGLCSCCRYPQVSILEDGPCRQSKTLRIKNGIYQSDFSTLFSSDINKNTHSSQEPKRTDKTLKPVFVGPKVSITRHSTISRLKPREREFITLKQGPFDT